MFFHYLVSRFPVAWWRFLTVMLNILPDVIAAVAVYAAVRTLASADPETQRLMAGLTVALFLSSPILLPFAARMFATNGRSLGGLWVQGYFLCVIMFDHDGAWGWLVLAVGLGVLTILTSLFAMQVMVSFSPLLAVLLWDWGALAALSVVLVLAWTVPALRMRDILQFKIAHWHWYRLNKNKTVAVRHRGLIRPLSAFARTVGKSPLAAIEILIRDTPIFILLYSLPILPVGLWLLWDPAVVEMVYRDPVLWPAISLAACSLVVFLLTGWSRFSEWGQAERYFEYSFPFLLTAIVLVGLRQDSLQAMDLIVIIALQGVVLIFLHGIGVTGLPAIGSNPNLPEEKAILQHLARSGKPLKIAVLPLKEVELFSYLQYTMEIDLFKFYFRFIVKEPISGGDAFEYFTKDVEGIGVFKLSPFELRREYGIDLLIIRRNMVRDDRPFWRDLAHCKKVAQTPTYELYEIKIAAATPSKNVTG